LFDESIKMGKTGFPRNMAAAVLASVAVHCIALIVYSFVAERLPAMKNYAPIMVSLVLPTQSVERSTHPFPSAAENKAASREEGNVESADAVNLIQEGNVEPVKESIEQPKDPSVTGGTVLSFTQKSELSTISVNGEVAAMPAKGRTAGSEALFAGTEKGSISGGDTAFPGYAKVETSPGGGLVFAAPRYGENSLPAYPMLARRRGYAGVVMLSVEVLADGRVGHLEIKKTSGYDLLDISAMDAVRVCKFSPAKKMGTPVPMWVDVPVRFALK
jgi:TonB family protein